MLEIWSATHASHLAGMQWKQVSWIGCGVVGMLLLSRIDYHAVMDKAPILYVIGLIALVAVLALGSHAIWREALASRAGRVFPGVRTCQVDYNCGVGEFFYRSTLGSALLRRSVQGCGV